MPVNSNELKASIRLDGGAQFRKDIAGVNADLKQLDAESKKVTEEFRGQANSIEALRAKHENLTRTLEAAERKVQIYDSRIKSLEQQQKRIADSTEEYRDQLKEAQSALSKMDKGTDAYAKQERAVEALARKVQLGEQNQAKATSEIAKYRVEQTKAETAVAKLNHELDDNSRYLNEAERSADQCADSIDEYGRRTKQAADESQGLGDVAKIALGNITADAARKLADSAMDAVRALMEAGRAAAAYADEILTASTVTGLSTDTLQEYAYAADLIDTDLEDVEKALARNVKSMSSAQSGSKAYAEAYEKLGVSVTDANGNLRSSEEVFWDCIDALGKVQNETEADAIAMQIFGKSARDLNPLIQVGSEGFRNFADEAHEAGAVLSGDTLDSLGKVDDSLQRLDSQMSAFKNAAGAAIAPVLGTLAEGATAVLKALTSAFSDPPNTELQNYIDGVRKSIEGTKEALEQIGTSELAVNTNSGEVEAYRQILLKATDAEKLNEVEKYQVNKAVEALKGSIPQLASAYDEETGKIKLTSDAVNDLIDSYQNQYKMQAYANLMTEAYETQAIAADNVTKAMDGWTTAKDKAQELGLAYSSIESLANNHIESVGELAYNLSQVMGISQREAEEVITELQTANQTYLDAGKANKAANDEVARLEKTVSDLTKEQEGSNDATKESVEATESYGKTVKNAVKAGTDFLKGLMDGKDASEESTEATEDATEATEENTDATEKNTDSKSKAQSMGEKFAETMQNVGDKILEAAEKQKQAEEQERESLQTIRQAYEDNYNSIKGTLDQKLSLWDTFNGGEDITVEQMIENLHSQTEGITQYKEEMAAVIAEYGDELGPDLINTLQSMGTEAANTWHHMFVTMSQDNAPELFAEMGQQWAEGLNLSDQIAKYCAGNLTAYQLATNQLGSTKIEWSGLRESVQEMTPELDAAITAAQEAGIQIPDGLAEGLQNGEVTATDAVNLLTRSMQGTFQGLYEIAEQSGVQIPEGLSAGMEGSAEEYQAAIGQLTEALSSAGNEAGTAAAEEISTGLSDNTSTVETAAGDTAGAAATAADGKKTEFQSAGTSAGAQYAAGMRGTRTLASGAGRQIATAAKEGANARASSFRDVGTNMAAALAAGIRAGQSQAINAAINMAVEAYRQAKAAIGQHSPTGIFKDELGKNIPLAVAAGITENTAPAQKAAATMARSTYSAARYAAMADAMDQQSTVTPPPVVNVDTSPIARMIGANQGGVQVINYNTFNDVKNPKAFADEFAAELTQRLRS